ncbi:hypothetical protein J3D45_002928 [Microbacterium foliorum]|uniref:ATP-binding protein n=1 Tax=Microbacterium foliorum TaxID=104336 RepID=UPI00209CDDAE|nr:ATP-binding protein [Microbacterium foliorum]MCP1430430.1 hypothetical protein [Microbacterium foliorum]
MVSIHVAAGKSLLEGYVKTPPTGICELIWNAFDADATSVSVDFDRGALGGIDGLHIVDDGQGMNLERAKLAFSHVGDSWKLAPGSTSNSGRPVHGKFGRGRYAAFSIGNLVRWVSTSEQIEAGTLATVVVKGARSDLSEFDIEMSEPTDALRGTSVEIRALTPEAVAEFEEFDGIRQRLLMEFALHLDRHADFKITFAGSEIAPSSVITSRTPIPLDLPADVRGPATLTIIEWDLTGVERRLYLCKPGGAIVGEMPPGIQAVGAEFTAYLEWSGFEHDQLVLEGDTDSVAGKVIEAGRTALRTHLAESSRRREAATVKRWKSEGVYPYKGEPRSDVERATRDTFNIVAMAASRTVDESRSRTSKALALDLLKETFESDPEALLPILRKFSQLPAARIEELAEILERTTLTQLIALGKEVGNRIDFLNGLNSILFDRQIKSRLLERRQLHRILAHETWLFGEEWSLTGDDERLSEVLKKFLQHLGENVELATEKPIVREDGSVAIPDLVLGRQLETRANEFSHLVIELKRPNHKLTDEDVAQLRSYASAITNDERFDQPNTSWEFWLIGNDTTNTVKEMREQPGQAHGVVQVSKKYKIIVRTWAEVIGDAEHRLKFVQRSLQYESTHDSGLASMRDRYAEYLPESALGENSLSGEEGAA